MGFSDLGIGLLLSINRWIRIPGNTYMAQGLNHTGIKNMALIASVLAVLTTFSYGMELGFLPFLMARIVWGLSYSGLKTASLAYTLEVKKYRGRIFGISHGIKSMGGIIAMGTGPFIMQSMGMDRGFFLLGSLSCLGTLLALGLPKVPLPYQRVHLKMSFVPSPFNLVVFGSSMAMDGILIVNLAHLLGAGTGSPQRLVGIMGFYLLIRNTLVAALPIIVGWLGRTRSIPRLFNSCLLVGILMWGALACGHTGPSLIAIFGCQAIVWAYTPYIAHHRYKKSPLPTIAQVGSWSDLGRALGALSGLWLWQLLGKEILCTFLMCTMLLLYLNYIQYEKRNRPPL